MAGDSNRELSPLTRSCPTSASGAAESEVPMPRFFFGAAVGMVGGMKRARRGTASGVALTDPHAG